MLRPNELRLCVASVEKRLEYPIFMLFSKSFTIITLALFALVILIEGVNSLSLFSFLAFSVATFSLDKVFYVKSCVGYIETEYV